MLGFKKVAQAKKKNCWGSELKWLRPHLWTGRIAPTKATTIKYDDRWVYSFFLWGPPPISLYHFSKTEKIGGREAKWNEMNTFYFVPGVRRKNKIGRRRIAHSLFFISFLFLHNHYSFVYHPHMHFLSLYIIILFSHSWDSMHSFLPSTKAEWCHHTTLSFSLLLWSCNERI